jgi:tRNA(adenine34) deaminase
MEQDTDTYFMQEALKEAHKALKNEEVPVGCVLVHERRIIARGYNQVEKLHDATAHAEILCLSQAGSELDNWRLLNTTLYVTLEPCLMCAGALFSCRVKRLVYAADDLRLGAFGSFMNVLEKKHPMHELEVTKHILKDESSFLLRSFFEKKRKQKEKISLFNQSI